MATTTFDSFIRTADYGPLLIEPTFTQSVAGQVSTTVQTSAAHYSLPTVVDDPDTGWFADGDTLTAASMTTDETKVAFSVVAGMVVIGNDVLDDADPELLTVIGQALARDIGVKVDAAFFGTNATATKQPAGLGDITPTAVTGDVTSGLDPYIDAMSSAEQHGSVVDHWTVSPATAAALAKLTIGTGSNQPLLGSADSGVGRSILGVPVIVSTDVADGTAWAIDSRKSFLVVRDAAEIITDHSRFVDQRRTAIIASMRVGFGFPHQAGLVKIAAA